MAELLYEQARAANKGRLKSAIKLIFPAFDDKPEKIVRFGTGNFNVDGENYVDALADSPTIRESSGQSSDGVSFTVDDADGRWYDELSAYEEVTENTEIITKECIEVAKGFYMAEEASFGTLDDFILNDVNRHLEFSALTGLSRTGLLVGGRILTMRYCFVRFNINGILSPLIDPCGWQTAQGGDPLYCDHTLDGAKGCNHHLNSQRIVMVEGLTTAPIQIVPGTGGGGTGWEYTTGGGCFTPMTLVPMWNGKTKPMHKVRKGDVVISFNAKGDLVPGLVLLNMRHLYEYVLMFEFTNGMIMETTIEQLFHIGNFYYKAGFAVESGDAIKSRFEYNNSASRQSIVKRTWVEERKTYVHGLHVDVWHNHLVGDLEKGALEVHNLKPELPVYN